MHGIELPLKAGGCNIGQAGPQRAAHRAEEPSLTRAARDSISADLASMSESSSSNPARRAASASALSPSRYVSMWTSASQAARNSSSAAASSDSEAGNGGPLSTHCHVAICYPTPHSFQLVLKFH